MNTTILAVVLLAIGCDCQFYAQPEQVHLSMGGEFSSIYACEFMQNPSADPTEMWVTWVTFNSTDASLVNYGETLLNLTSVGTQTDFVDGGSERRHIYIHRALLQQLVPGRSYGELRFLFVCK